MAVLRWTCVILSLGLISCYENLSRKNSTIVSQSSTYLTRYANYSNDGKHGTTENECSHTGIGHKKAWFQVDLKEEYSLKSITITYRDEGLKWKPHRLRQFYLDVANSSAAHSNTSERVRCYKDNTEYPSTPKNIIDIPCKQRARFVIVETTYDTPNDNETGAILEMCEIEVYGCPLQSYGQTCTPCGSCIQCDVEIGCVCPPGYYGTSCTLPCSTNCHNGSCDLEYGRCSHGCVDGYYGYMCNTECNSNCLNNRCSRDGKCRSGCVKGVYGYFCNMTCNNCKNKLCSRDDGRCTSGCKEGFYGNRCENACGRGCIKTCDSYGYCNCISGWKYYHCDVCDATHYGENCSNKCSSKCSNSYCDSQNGDCLGCHFKSYGNKCQYNCSNCNHMGCDASGVCKGSYCSYGFWGSLCDKTCGKCLVYNGRYECEKKSGKCLNSCETGFYGDSCTFPCSPQCINKQCNGYTGHCDSRGCITRYHGYKCDTKCSSNCVDNICDGYYGKCIKGCNNGFFGHNCTYSCPPNCKNNKCNQDNEECSEGCKPGQFGNDCETPCLQSTFCLHNTCYQNNGSCNQGCIEGWQEPFCNECGKTYYGHTCEERCLNCVDDLCFRGNGSCILGCLGVCKSGMLTDTVNSTMIGAGVGSVVVIILIIIIVFIVLRNRGTQQNKKPQQLGVIYQSDSHSIRETTGYSNLQQVLVEREDEFEEPYVENPEEAVYYNHLTTAKDISVTDLLNVIRRKEANKNEGFKNEYKTLPYGERFDCYTAKLEENVPKNRFKTTFPYDHSRVILEVNEGFQSDYINANFIGNLDGKPEFIACQGPRNNTLVDHWRMIWQEGIEYIVMLTNLIEGPKVKCHQYWPDEGDDLDVDPFSITLVEEKVYAYYVIRRLTVRKKTTNGSRTVLQFHYTRWPDHGTPNPLNLVIFQKHIRNKIIPSQHPILVHCSAGIGRTGTFIALDVLSRYGTEKGKINIIEFVKNMRKDRMTMIQNADQYVFLYHALHVYFKQKGKLIQKEEFCRLFGGMETQEIRKSLTDEFNELKSLKPNYIDKDFKTGKAHPKLNMTKSVLPVEQYLVYLTSNVRGRDTYYNAVTVSSFTQAEEFVSAQHPVSGASIDFVRLLIDQESSFLISLNPLSDVKELKDWVDDDIKTISLDPYEITKNTQTTVSNDIRKTNIDITRKKENQSHSVHIYECLNWCSNDKLPVEASTLTNLVKQFTLDRKSQMDGHVTLVSRDGATCCGVFFAVYNVIEQLQQDDEVDMFSIVQQLQCRRPEMISSKEEYEYCFKAVNEYLSTDSMYANV